MNTVTFTASSSNSPNIKEGMATDEIEKVEREFLDSICSHLLQRAASVLLPALSRDVRNDRVSECFEYEYRDIKFLIKVERCKWDMKFIAHITLEIPEGIQDFDGREMW